MPPFARRTQMEGSRRKRGIKRGEYDSGKEEEKEGGKGGRHAEKERKSPEVVESEFA